MKNEKTYSYGKQYIDNDDIQAVTEALQDDIITRGKKTKELETKISKLTGHYYSRVVNSGTSALFLALRIYHFDFGSEIIVSPLTFNATITAIINNGLFPIFCDIDKDTLQIDYTKIEKLITPRTKAVITMDYAGQQCDFPKIRQLCDNYGLKLISDSCHSFGLSCSDKYTCYPHISCYSFHPVKTITTGEGGAICLECDYNKNSLDQLIDNGRIESKYVVTTGYNFHMSEINATLGLSQFKKLDDFISKRRWISTIYSNEFPDLSIKTIRDSVHHLHVLRVKNRSVVIDKLNDKNIFPGVHYPNLFDQPFYNCNKFNEEYQKKNIKVCFEVWPEIISLPIYYSLTDNDLDYIVNSIKQVLKETGNF